MTTSPTSSGTGPRPLLLPPEPSTGPDGPRRPLVQLELPLAPGRSGSPDGGGRPSGVGTRSEWRLDDDTRRTGRAGVAAARAILARSDRAA